MHLDPIYNKDRAGSIRGHTEQQARRAAGCIRGHIEQPSYPE